MYFDIDYYTRVVKHVWSLRDWPGRRKMLFRLLFLVPLEYLFNSLCFLLDYILFPALWQQQVHRPVFIVGHARSGTTLAHRLLAADGDTFSYFLYWEMYFPSLVQKKLIRGLGWLDERFLNKAWNRRLVAWDDKTFGPFRHMHDMSLWNSEEDQFVMRAAFLSQQWTMDIPMLHIIDIFHVDEMSARKRRKWLHHYKECVKRQLLLNGGDRVHLSKNPVMSGWVQALLETFPDARIVTMMRNPIECIPSVLQLVEVTWKARGWTRDDYADSQRRLTKISFESYVHPKSVLQRFPMTPSAVVDYRKLTSEPHATVVAIYTALGIPMSAEYNTYLEQQEGREKAHKTSFRYSIDDFEVSLEDIETELDAFFDAYGWQRPSATAVSQ